MFDKAGIDGVSFTPLPQSEDVERLSPGQIHNHGHPSQWQASKLKIGVMILAGYLLGGLVGIWVGRTWIMDADKFCIQRTSKSSPLIGEVPMTLHEVLFNGSFLKQTIYREPAGPAVDAAWAALGIDYLPARVPASYAAASGLSPSTHVSINPAHGGGFPANVEGLHHLHCLNLLRQALYYNYEYYSSLQPPPGAFKNSADILQKHVSHCVDILRQQLMCTADLGVMGQVWWKSETMDRAQPFVDFNTKHTCRNFEGVRQWAEKNQLPADVPSDFLVPPTDGVRVLPEVP